VADAIESVYASGLDPHVSALAHHLYQAGSVADPEKSIHFLLEAAGQANLAVAYEDALDLLGKAISLLDGKQAGRTAELYARRAATLVSLSRHPEAILEYERTLCSSILWMTTSGTRRFVSGSTFFAHGPPSSKKR
jgi:hypothetical protein